MANVMTITPTLDTNAFQDGDVLFNPVKLADVVPNPSETVMLHSVAVVDASDQGTAFDLVFFNSGDASLGTVNAAVSITDAHLAMCIGRVQILASDYYDMGGARFADVGGISKLLRCAHNTKDIWVGAVARGAPTYAANALTIRLGFVS